MRADWQLDSETKENSKDIHEEDETKLRAALVTLSLSANVHVERVF